MSAPHNLQVLPSMSARRHFSSTDTLRKTAVHPDPTTGIPAGSHPLAPGKSSRHCTPRGSRALPPCIAVPFPLLSPAQSNDCTPFHADAHRHAAPRGPSPQSPHGIRGPPKSLVRRLPTNNLPGMPPRSAASPVVPRRAHPPGSNFFFRYSKRSTATAQGHVLLPAAPAVHSAVPQTPLGSHGPPRSRVHRTPMKLPHRKAPRYVAG